MEKKIFYIKNYKENKLFYKINLKSKSSQELERNPNKVVSIKYVIENLKLKKTK